MLIGNWNCDFGKHKKHSILLVTLLLYACGNTPVAMTMEPTASPTETVLGCDGQTYPDPSTSLYVLPYAVGQIFKTGLTNCSSSYHSAGQPDQYAFDFDMPIGTPFLAARAGEVISVVENEPSNGGGVGNYVIINHGDDTYGIYLHSSKNGISVTIGDIVKQGDILGETGRSGLAGYPHLHFIVVKGIPSFPYDGVAISFRNALPGDVIIKGYTQYEAGPYEIIE